MPTEEFCTEPRYLFIAHKPESADYCRGCLMHRYDGGFEHEPDLSRDLLVRHWTELALENKKLRRSEKGWCFFVHRGGYHLYDANHPSSMLEDEDLIREIQGIEDEVNAAVEAQLQAAREAAAQKEAARRHRLAQEQRNNELTLLQNLKDKYPNQ